MSSAAAFAGGAIDGTVTVKAEGGEKPVRNAFVWVDGYSDDHPSEPVHISQQGRTFTPAVAGVVKGQRVLFTNDEGEEIYHHVFTPTSGYNLNPKVFKHPGSTTSDPLSKLGRVDVFCDIHKDMYATLWVVNNKAFAVTDEKGHFHIDTVRPGSWTAHAWHRSSDQQVATPIAVVEGKTQTLSLTLSGNPAFEEFLSKHKRIHEGKTYEKSPDGGCCAGEHSSTDW